MKGADGRQLLGMSLLMRPGLDYVMDRGHHRSPFFLRAEGIEDWIAGGERDSAESLEVLREHAEEPELQHVVARQMAAGWKKRQATNVTKRDEQRAAIDAVHFSENDLESEMSILWGIAFSFGGTQAEVDSYLDQKADAIAAVIQVNSAKSASLSQAAALSNTYGTTSLSPWQLLEQLENYAGGYGGGGY